MVARSQRITFRDVGAVSEAVHECRQLWVDPPAWQAHALRRAAALAGCRIGIDFEMADHAGVTADRVLSASDVGWTSADERHTVIEGIANRPLRYSPLWANFADALATRRGRSVGALTARQDRVIGVKAWQSSEMYDRHVRPTRLGDVILSAVWLPHLATWSVWSLVTDRADPAPTRRNARLVRLLHRQVAPLIGTTLATWRDRTVAPLTTTRRRVLEALLDGRAEPEIAERACRSRSAIHEHVTALYRHFGVRSRGELAAYFLRRRPLSAGRAARVPSTEAWLDREWAA